MGGAARLGDPISCGDHLSVGSADVFVNGMPMVHQGTPTTTGHGCFPPTIITGGFAGTVFCNGQPVAIAGMTTIIPHRCGDSVHGGILSSGSPDVSVE